MGNCIVSNQRSSSSGEDQYIGVGRRFDRKYSDDEMDKELRDPFSNEKVLDATESETFSSDATAPLSPDSTAFALSPTGTSHLTISPLASPRSLTNGFNSNAAMSTAIVSLESEMEDLVSPLSSDRDNYSRSIVPAISPHRRGRALQARLQKARDMQMALTTTTLPIPLSSPSSTSMLYHNRRTISSSDQSQSSRSLGASSMTSDRSTETSGIEQLESFEMSGTSAAIWAELELDSAVLCTALSRTTPCLSKPVAPLYIAIGTESGTIAVYELLPDDTTTNNNHGYTVPALSFGSRNKKSESDTPKFGPPVYVHLNGRVRSLDFSTDGQYLAAGGDDCKCHVFQLGVEEGEDGFHSHLAVLHWKSEIERVDRVYAVQFSPNNRFLAVGGFDGTVAIVDTVDISSKVQLEALAEVPRDGLVMAVDWSPDSQYLAIGGSDKCCALVHCSESWQVAREIKRSSSVQSIKWYPTGKYLAIGTNHTVAIVLGRDSFALVNEINIGNRTRQETAVYKNNAICWSPSGSYLVVSGHDCTFYETKKFTVVHHIPRPSNTTSVVWGQQGALTGGRLLPRCFLVMGGEDRKVILLKSGLEENGASGSSLGGDDLSSAAGSSYASVRGDWTLKDNEFRDVEEEVDISVDGQMHLSVGNGDANVLAVAFSKGSKSRPSVYFAHSTDNGLVTIRSCTGWTVLAEIQFPEPVETMSFSNGSRFLALGCMDSNVYVSDTVANWELVAKIEFAAPICAVQFGCKNNERLVVGSEDGTLAFLDTLKGYDFSGEIEARDSPVAAVDWSSRNLAVGRDDGTVTIYDSASVLKNTYVSVADVEREAAICTLSFGVSSRFLAVGDAAGLVGIYSSKGGWVLCHQIVMGNSVSSVLWCPLGRHLAYSSDNGALKVIDTIFWTDVEEAESHLAPTASGSVVRSKLAFSQDGRMLSQCRSDQGLYVMDSALKWNVTLNMIAEPLTEIESDHDTEGSGLSSQDEAPVKKAARLYEV